MKSHLYTALFLLLCIGIGAGIGFLIMHWQRPGGVTNDMSKKTDTRPIILTGEGDPPGLHGFTLAGADVGRVNEVLSRAEALHLTSLGIEYDAKLTREALMAAVTAAHQKGLQVILLPPPVFSAENPYAKPLAEVAADAEAAHVDYLTISWLNTIPNQDYWRVRFGDALVNFRGKLIMAATADVLLRAGSSRADVLGVIGPVPLPKRLASSSPDVDEHDMRVAWDCTLTMLESMANNNHKTLALLHMNVPATFSARMAAPGQSEVVTQNPKLQETVYQALLMETKGRYQYTSIMLFDWGRPDDADVPNNLPGMLDRIGAMWTPKKSKTAG